MEYITLKQLIDYYRLEGEPAKIQIVSGIQEWSEADEVSYDSLLLNPFLDWNVTYLKVEKAHNGKDSVIRIAIAPQKE